MNDNEWITFIQKLGKNPSTKPFWKRINKLKGKKSKSNIPTLKVGNDIYETDKEKADLFAQSLKTTFSLATGESFDDNFKLNVENTIKEHDFKKHEFNNKDLFSLKDLNLAIKGLKKNSACGEDGIHNLMLIKTTQEFRKIILLLINETVKQAIIPESWKSSIINMIPKKQQNSSNPKDYRPISLTSCLGKLAERLMLKKIKDFMDKNKIIIKH